MTCDDNPIYNEMQAEFQERAARLIDQQVQALTPGLINELEAMLAEQ